MRTPITTRASGLYYTAVDGDGERLPITPDSGLSEDDELDRFSWDLIGVAPGRYQVLGTITDGAGASWTSYAPGSVTVAAPAATVPALPGAYAADADFRLDDDVAGPDKTLINSVLAPERKPPSAAPIVGALPDGSFADLPGTTGGVGMLDISGLFSDVDDASLRYRVAVEQGGDALGVRDWQLTGSLVPLHLLDGAPVTLRIEGIDAAGNSATQRVQVQATGADPALGNHPPRLVLPFADIRIDSLSGQRRFDLAGHFADADGDALLFSVAAEPGSVGELGVLRELVVRDGALLVTPGPDNDADGILVRVSVSDGIAPASEHRFRIRVGDGLDSGGTAPLVIGPVDDFRLGKDETPFRRALHAIFLDPDGDPMTFSVRTDRNVAGKISAVLDPADDPTHLVVTALREGGAGNSPVRVIVTATDSTNRSSSERFWVKAKDNRAPRCFPDGERGDGRDDTVIKVFLDRHYEVDQPLSDEMPIDLALYCYDPDGHYPLTVSIAAIDNNTNAAGRTVLRNVELVADPDAAPADPPRFAGNLSRLQFVPAAKSGDKPVKIILRLRDAGDADGERNVNDDQRISVVVSERRARFKTVKPAPGIAEYSDPYDFDGDGHAHAIRLYYDADVTGTGAAGSTETLLTRAYVRRHRSQERKAAHGGEAAPWYQCGESEQFSVDGIGVELDADDPASCADDDPACTLLCELDADFAGTGEQGTDLSEHAARGYDVKLVLCRAETAAGCNAEDGYDDKAGPADRNRLENHPMEGVVQDIGYRVSGLELAGAEGADRNGNGYSTAALVTFDIDLLAHASIAADLPEQLLSLTVQRRRTGKQDWNDCADPPEHALTFSAAQTGYEALDFTCTTTAGMGRAKYELRLLGVDERGDVKLRASLGSIGMEGSDRDGGIGVGFVPRVPEPAERVDLDGDGNVSAVTFAFDVNVTAQDEARAVDASRDIRVSARFRRTDTRTGDSSVETCDRQRKLHRITGDQYDDFELTCAFADKPPPQDHEQDSFFLRADNAAGEALGLSDELVLPVEGGRQDKTGIGLSDLELVVPPGGNRDRDLHAHQAEIRFTVTTDPDAAAEPPPGQASIDRLNAKVFVSRSGKNDWHRCGLRDSLDVPGVLRASILCEMIDDLADRPAGDYDVKLVVCLAGEPCHADNNAAHFARARFDDQPLEGKDNDPVRIRFAFRPAPATKLDPPASTATTTDTPPASLGRTRWTRAGRTAKPRASASTWRPSVAVADRTMFVPAAMPSWSPTAPTKTGRPSHVPSTALWKTAAT
jgi:hypothetical protein